jgi:hypothetical protein
LCKQPVGSLVCVPRTDNVRPARAVACLCSCLAQVPHVCEARFLCCPAASGLYQVTLLTMLTCTPDIGIAPLIFVSARAVHHVPAADSHLADTVSRGAAHCGGCLAVGALHLCVQRCPSVALASACTFPLPLPQTHTPSTTAPATARLCLSCPRFLLPHHNCQGCWTTRNSIPSATTFSPTSVCCICCAFACRRSTPQDTWWCKRATPLQTASTL